MLTRLKVFFDTNAKLNAALKVADEFRQRADIAERIVDLLDRPTGGMKIVGMLALEDAQPDRGRVEGEAVVEALRAIMAKARRTDIGVSSMLAEMGAELRHIPFPRTIAEAEFMQMVGYRFLADRAPEKLTDPAKALEKVREHLDGAHVLVMEEEGDKVVMLRADLAELFRRIDAASRAAGLTA